MSNNFTLDGKSHSLALVKYVKVLGEDPYPFVDADVEDPTLLFSPIYAIVDTITDEETKQTTELKISQIMQPQTPELLREWEATARMCYLAYLFGYKKSPYFYNIAKSRARLKLRWDSCPCGGEGRGCISELCHSEIEKDGHCHCNCFWKKDYNG